MSVPKLPSGGGQYTREETGDLTQTSAPTAPPPAPQSRKPPKSAKRRSAKKTTQRSEA